MEKAEYENVKTPLSYQITEYDCGQTTFVNALRYLFKRDEIEPAVVKMIMGHTLDQIDCNGEIGKGGTSIYAMEFLSQWLNDVSSVSDMKLKTKIVKGEDVNTENEELIDCLKHGGAAILRVCLSEEHYVLCTNIDEEFVYLFDPYYLDANYYNGDSACEVITDRIFEFNRKVLKTRLDEYSNKDFCLVDGKNRAMMLLYRI